MDSYRAADRAWQDQAAAASSGYATELADFTASNPRPTFRQWLMTYREDR